MNTRVAGEETRSIDGLKLKSSVAFTAGNELILNLYVRTLKKKVFVGHRNIPQGLTSTFNCI